MGTLYLVSTPIGNLKDITLRALETLAAADLILCEDTRRTQKLMAAHDIKKPLLSYFEHNELRRLPQAIKLLKEGKRLALVSNAGTPLISDPGFKLVRQCLEEEIRVEPIPGASAVTAALVISGLPTDKFLFFGFLPHKQGKRQKLLEVLRKTLQSIQATVVFFESPHRLLGSLNSLKEAFGDIEVVICLELTKLHETVRRERVSEAIEHFSTAAAKPRGEITLLFHLP